MAINFRIISIGALSRHDLWQGNAASATLRTAHATTTLIRSGDRVILVDPALPSQALVPRLNERCGLRPEDITTIFLTNFRPAHRMGLEAFDQAQWLVFETERERIGRQLLARFDQEEDNQVRRLIEYEIGLLKKTQAAPDRLAEDVDLFPLPGYTPGTCGLLLSLAGETVLVAGDAVPTVEHLESSQVLRSAFDVNQAMDSLVEAIEIADQIVCGHDNVVPNRTRRAGL
ncbi:MAG: MBL fold metallo-hydrolase [Planctomycetota bacterium]